MTQLTNLQFHQVKSVTAKLHESSGSSHVDITVTNNNKEKVEITLFAGGNSDTMKLFRELNRAIEDANLACTF